MACICTLEKVCINYSKVLYFLKRTAKLNNKRGKRKCHASDLCTCFDSTRNKNYQQLVRVWQFKVSITMLYSSAVCSPTCANGGTCVSPNTCDCPSGWTGSTCSQRELYILFSLAIYLPLVECQCFAVSRT